MNSVTQHLETFSIAAVCEALGIPRASYYRSLRSPAPHAKRPSLPRSLGDEERQDVLDVLHSPRLVHQAPARIWATLLDGGASMCSISTASRILRKEHQIRERRNQLRQPAYAKPELLARAPNQVWSRDFTKLRGPTKRIYFHPYVILDYDRTDVVIEPGHPVLSDAYRAHPERFVHRAPAPVPQAVWVHPPKTTQPRNQEGR